MASVSHGESDLSVRIPDLLPCCIPGKGEFAEKSSSYSALKSPDIKSVHETLEWLLLWNSPSSRLCTCTITSNQVASRKLGYLSFHKVTVFAIGIVRLTSASRLKWVFAAANFAVCCQPHQTFSNNIECLHYPNQNI